jgi:teichuronic acid biosynthesis glycosyltransferase TuaG
MDFEKKVSIIMPAYNAGKYIADAIESVLNQTFTNWELIIVDDESTDDTAEIVRRYQEKWPSIIYRWQKNSKQGKTRNEAIRLSQGRYLAFMDADDLWVPDKLARQVEMLTEQKADVVFGYAYLIDNGIKTLKRTGRGLGLYKDGTAVDFFLYHEALVISTVIATREAILKVECFVEDVNIQYCEDWHIWLKLALQGFSFYTDSNVVSYYRVHSESAAKTEKEANVKFLLALLDLHYKYPENPDVKDEVFKRACLLVYHTSSMRVDLVRAIGEFLRKNNYARLLVWLYVPLLKLNESLFRKFFLFSVR